MSHFTTVVILPIKALTDKEDKLLTKLLAPYDENTRVAPYDQNCGCKGNQARKAARLVAEKTVAPFETLRTTFNAKADQLLKQRYPDADADEVWTLRQKIVDELDWNAHIAKYVEVENQAFDKHPLKGAIDPKCVDCKGTGKYKSTYNPKSKWDWWTVGGRWDGAMLRAFNPEVDNHAFKICGNCEGTGDGENITYIHRKTKEVLTAEKARQLWVTQEIPTGKVILTVTHMPKDWRQDTKNNWSCETCGGTGVLMTLPKEYKPFKGNILPVILVPKGFSPFAMITPDGLWHEKGHMGWWAITSDEKGEETWKQMVKDTFERYQDDHIAVLCDLHI